MKEYLAVIGGLLAAFSTLPYLIDIVKRRTKPNIVSWLTWSILTAIATAAAFAGHEPRSAFLTLGATICTGAVVVLGIKYGIAHFSRFDMLCQASAVLGLIAWLVFNSPLIGIIIPLGIDFIAALPTFHHSWLKPGEETWQTFVIGSAAALLTVLSLAHFTAIGLLFPLYLFLVNGAEATVILYRRNQLGLSFWEGQQLNHGLGKLAHVEKK